MPKVSVILVVKDAVETVVRAVQSVLAQSYVDVELTIVDGASTDGTRALLKAYGRRVHRIISEPDQGIADAMNKGLAASTGDWVYFIGADDRLADVDSLAAMLDAGSANGADIVAGSVLVEDATGSTRRLDPRGCSFAANFKTPVLHQGSLCQRALFDRIGPFDRTFRIAMDYDFFLRACRHDVRVCRLDRVIAVMDEGGIGSRTDWASLRSRFDEERLVHLRHCESRGLRVAYGLYHPFYRLYRRLIAWNRR
jgi:glycosyltransferase involved in cell wall biosynthesis